MSLFRADVRRGEPLDLMNRGPKLLLPVQERPSGVWPCVALDLIRQLAEVAGDLLDASDRVLRRHGAQPNQAWRCSPAHDRGRW
jgi:hypothetical protein